MVTFAQDAQLGLRHEKITNCMIVMTKAPSGMATGVHMITKIEAAEKQLDTAIKLFFENIDYLSSYTLASASREITDDLCEKQKDKIYLSELQRLGDPQKVRLSFRDEMEILIKPEYHKEAMRLLKKTQNFLKHADRDHDQGLDSFSMKELSFVICFAVKNFALLEKRWSTAMATFFYWFLAANPDLMVVNKSKDDSFLKIVTKIRTEFPDLYSPRTFTMIYEGLKLSAPHLFSQSRS